MATQEQRVLITGVSGYVGSWCANLALEAGYTVIGTVRNPDSAKCKFLQDVIAGRPGKMSSKAAQGLHLVSADLLAGDDFWSDLFKREKPDFVLHTASPYFAKTPADENDYIRPAVEGTTSVMRAAVAHGVKRVVVTSSVAAVWEPLLDGHCYTKSDWSDTGCQSAYGKSKTMAERAAWKVVEGTDVELSTVNPMFIIGPTLYTDKALIQGFESGNLASKIMNGKIPMQPRSKMGISDVRDVAAAHIRALTTQSNGERFILTKETIWFKDIVQLFSEAHPKLSIGVKQAPGFVIKGLAFLGNKEMQATAKLLDKDYTVESSNVQTKLGLEFTSQKKSVADMMDDLLELGAVSSEPRPKSAVRLYLLAAVGIALAAGLAWSRL